MNNIETRCLIVLYESHIFFMYDHFTYRKLGSTVRPPAKIYLCSNQVFIDDLVGFFQVEITAL